MYKRTPPCSGRENMKDSVIHMMEETIADYVNQCASECGTGRWDMDTGCRAAPGIIPFGKIELTQEDSGRKTWSPKRLQDEAVGVCP